MGKVPTVLDVDFSYNQLTHLHPKPGSSLTWPSSLTLASSTVRCEVQCSMVHFRAMVPDTDPTTEPSSTLSVEAAEFQPYPQNPSAYTRSGATQVVYGPAPMLGMLHPQVGPHLADLY